MVLYVCDHGTLAVDDVKVFQNQKSASEAECVAMLLPVPLLWKKKKKKSFIFSFFPSKHEQKTKELLPANSKFPLEPNV